MSPEKMRLVDQVFECLEAQKADPDVSDSLTYDEIFERVSNMRFKSPAPKDLEEVLDYITCPLFGSAWTDDQGKYYSTGGKSAMLRYLRSLEECARLNGL